MHDAKSVTGRLENAKNEWLRWWESQSYWQKLLPLAAVALYWFVISVIGGKMQDPVMVGFVTLLLFYGGPVTRKIRIFIFPLILTGVVYDSQRYYADALRGTIHVVEPYEIDKAWFGIDTAQGRLTPNEYLQQFIHPAMDLITGFAYLVYMLQYVIVAGFFFFWASKRGTPKHSPEFIARYSTRLMWGFFFVNLIGYITYYIYPAAPPWYVTNYGFAPPLPDTPPDPAGTIRFDQILGTSFFTGMYEKSANVFGAIPSLHAAYPLLGAYYAFKLGALRGFTVVFWLLICFAAVYLNHHYVIDVLLGSLYALVVPVTMDLLLARQESQFEGYGLQTQSADAEES